MCIHGEKTKQTHCFYFIVPGEREEKKEKERVREEAISLLLFAFVFFGFSSLFWCTLVGEMSVRTSVFFLHVCVFMCVKLCSGMAGCNVNLR